MHGRILFGVVAWLLGAATATAGSLLAVSLLGQGITGATGPLLSQVAVNRALASETAEPATSPASSGTASPGGTRAASGAGEPSSRGPSSGGPSSGGPSSGAPSSGAASPAGGSSAGASPSVAPPGTPAATPSADGTSDGGTSDGGTSDGGTVLVSRGGDVVASCQAAGAYLDSWSPAQGFVAGDVRRGPSQVARVTFDPASGSGNSDVTMLVSCSAGIPSATTKSWGTGDD